MQNKIYRLTTSILVLLAFGYGFYIAIPRLEDVTLFNVLLVIALFIGCINMARILLRNKSAKKQFPIKKSVLVLNGLVIVCLIPIAISMLSDVFTLSKNEYAVLFFLSVILFSSSILLTFLDRKKREKKPKIN